MSGIIAIHDTKDLHNPSGSHAAQGQRMLDRLSHRGSDQAGIRQVGPTWLGQLRLSIIDLKGGGQPMGSATGNWLVANGEIYNDREIRKHTSFDFRTRSDSEVILAALESGDIKSIGQLQGMFAFVVAHEDGSMVAARDRLGIKPLYWATVGTATYFASELGAFDPEMRPHVQTFPPGHVWTPEAGLARFPDADDPVRQPSDRAEASESIRAALIAAVRNQMRADVPVGVFLSGGLDSSLVAAIMAQNTDLLSGPVHSFSAGTTESSDLLAARRVAEHLGLEHHERIYSSDEVVEVLPTVVARIESYEPTLIRSSVPNYLLARMASEKVTVVLTGEGADELFAGYDYLRDVDNHKELHAELERSVAGMHSLGLQRADRVTMAHGVEARVPFLDENVVRLAELIPAEWKLPGEYGQEKRLLREAFEGWLPDDLLWRPKEQFGDGSGTADLMAAEAATLVPEDDWHSIRVGDLPAPRSREELAYQRMFAEHLEGVRPEVLGRFATV